MWLELSEVAKLEELRQAKGLGEVAEMSEPLCGGTMGGGFPGNWHNNAVGVGFNGPVTKADIDRMIEFYASRGCEPRVEVCPFADKSLSVELGNAGFRIADFEMVFFRLLDEGKPARPVHGEPEGVELAFVDPADAARVREYARVAASGFMPEGQEIPEEFLKIAETPAKHPLCKGVVGMVEGRIVGAGGMEVRGEVAALFGLSVLPEFRRRGIQQALIAKRLNYAASKGARIATIGGRPGQGTERNVRRMGFQCAYTKLVMVRPGEGLAAVVG